MKKTMRIKDSQAFPHLHGKKKSGAKIREG